MTTIIHEYVAETLLELRYVSENLHFLTTVWGEKPITISWDALHEEIFAVWGLDIDLDENGLSRLSKMVFNHIANNR